MNQQTHILKPLDVAQIHWKVQAIVHFMLSIPLAILTVYSWGVTSEGVVKVLLAYLALYIILFFPLYGILPFFTLRKIKKELHKINTNQTLTYSEASSVVTFLLNYPLPTALLTVVIEMTAFLIGSLAWQVGIVPELLPLRNVTLLETSILGIITSINVAFLNLIQLENSLSNVIEKIVQKNPDVLEAKLPIRRFSMYKKVLFLILLTTIAGEISILLFFITYILSNNAEQLIKHGSFILSIFTINILYVFILAPIVAKNFTAPMNKLVSWIKDVTHGNMDSRINFITNDETEDIIKGSNVMITTVDKVTSDLTNSLQILKNRSELLESEKNKLSTVLLGIVDGVVALNGYRQVILLNKAAEEIIGMQEHEAIKKDIKEVLYIQNEKGESLLGKDFFPSLDSKASATFSNVKLLTHSGKTRFINITCSTTGGQKGADTSYIITFHDMTEERELENMKLDFVSMAAHELRTPTTIMKGYLETYLQQYGKDLSVDQNMMVTRTLYTARQLSSLINILLTVSKVERKVVDLDIVPIEWKSFIEHTIQDLTYMAKEKDIEVENVFSEGFAATVEFDQNRIAEVLGNLISNAVNYSKEKSKIIVRVEENPDEVITHIQDFGIGIPTDAIPRLFTKFYRVSKPLQDEAKGTGLGLYLAKAIIEMHGGKIWVTSKEDVGSTFSFSLPKKHKTPKEE